MTRKTKRELARLEAKIREKLVPMTEQYTSKFLEGMIEDNQVQRDELYLKLNTEWRRFSNNIIMKNPNNYNDPAKKVRLVNAFSNFVAGMYKKLGSPLDEI